MNTFTKTVGCKLSLLMALALVLSCSTSNNAQQTLANDEDTSFVGRHGQLSVNGTSLVDKNGETVVLRGVSFGWHNWWPRFYTSSTVAWLATDWNVNLVRAAIGAEPPGAYISHPQLGQQCLDTVTDAAIKNGIYVIADWHSHNIRLEEAKAFFTRVAEKYKDYPNIIYEIFNEPEQQSWNEVKAYSEEIIKTIRAIDAKNVILVGCPHWDQDIHLPAADPIKGYSNIMYTLHFYAATHKQSLRDRAGAALQKGLPIFVSECAGMEASGDGAINEQEWTAWKQWMQTHNISWAAWSVSDKNETCSMVQGTSSPVSGWADADLKAWGITVKNALKDD
jgi:endoglucanase